MATSKPKSTTSKSAAKPEAAKKTAAKKVAPATSKAAPAAKKVAAKKAAPELKVFQFYTEGWQRELLDPAFVALDGSKLTTSELREVAVMGQLQQDAVTKGLPLWGVVSWQFTEKTGLNGRDFVKQITENPGHDVYFCNPYVTDEAAFHNTWLQGSTEFDHFMPLVQSVFKAAGLDVAELTAVQPSATYSRGNYLVATPKFWAAYLSFVGQVLTAADKKLPPAVRQLMHTVVADPRGVYGGATYVPFIVERLFSYFMHKYSKGLKAFKLTLPKAEAGLNVHQKLLREMKNVAHQTKSPWMAACWVNYRNLYLGQSNSKAWCTKYLRAITPGDVHFA